jgi:hypothetical protein
LNDIKIQKHKLAIANAKEFIRRSEAAIKQLKEDENSWFRSKKNSAALRASLDLSESLVDLRRGNYIA